MARLVSNNKELSFEALVQEVSKKDLRSRVVLDELIRLNIARINNDDLVELNVEALVPAKDFEEKTCHFGQNLRDHITAACQNLLDEQPPFFDRSVYYNNLTAESVEILTLLSKKLATDTLKKVNRKASELQSLDTLSSTANQRFNLGIYLFSAPQADNPREKEIEQS